jgi:hypothetical protein
MIPAPSTLLFLAVASLATLAGLLTYFTARAIVRGFRSRRSHP